MATRMQQRRGTAAQWTSANPILAAGEIGFETDSGKFKMGNGSSAWSALSYFADAADFDTAAIESTIDSKVADAVSDLVAGAPAALDTLNELAAAIDDDSSFAATITSALATKAGATVTTQHIEGTTNVHGISNTADLATKSYADSAVTTHKNLTTDIHGIADTADLVLSGDLSAHNNETSNVHGITDTTALATNSSVDSAISAHSSDSTNVHGIGDTALLATKAYADSAVSTHNSDKTDVHGITNTEDLVYTSDSRLSDTRTPSDSSVSEAKIENSAVTESKIASSAVTEAKIADGSVTSAKIANGTIVDTDISSTAAIAQGKIDGLTDSLNAKAPLADPTFTGTVSGITKSMVGLGNVDNTADADKPVSTATQTALDAKAPLADPTFTGTVVLPSTTSIGTVTATELGYVDGVTSAIQTQLDAKLASATASSTYAPIANPTFTGTVSGVTKAHVGLGNVDNTSDADKPVSTATQTALDAKASLSGATFTGSVEIDQNLTVDGNLTVTGTTTTVSATDLVVSDPLIYLGEGNTGNLVDLGFVGSYNDGTYAHQGLVKDSSAGTWKLFKGVTDEPTTTVNFAQGSLDALALGALTASSATIGDVSNTELQYLNGVTSAVQTQIDAKAPIASPTFTGTVTVAANGIAFTDGTQTKEGTPSRTPIVQKTSAYTLSALSERDNLIEVSSATAVTLTIPTNATVAYPVGTSIDILQTSTGQVTIAGAAGVTVNATPGLKLRTQWSSATLFKRATDTWVVMGDLSA